MSVSRWGHCEHEGGGPREWQAARGLEGGEWEPPSARRGRLEAAEQGVEQRSAGERES